MTDKIVIDSLHSQLGPSSSDRWLNCPGSTLLIRDMEGTSSWFAAEGNAAHELSEWCRVQQKPAEHWRGQVIVVGEHEFTVEQEMIDGVNEFVEWCEQWPGMPLYEVMVDYEPWVPGGFGTLDDGRLKDHVCRVTDLKYGKGVQVFADNNPQLKLYALGLYNNYRHLFDFDHFILTIHQPRLNHVDTWETDLPDLLEWAEQIVKPTAEIALKPGAPLKAGDHCKFCPARYTCKTRADYVTRTVVGEFDNLDAGPQELAFLTNDQIGLILPELPNIKKWCSDLEAYARSEIAKGKVIPHPEFGDFKLIEGRSNRVWKLSEEETYEGLALEVVDTDELWDRKLKSPPQVEKMVGKGKINDLIHKPKGAPKLAPGNDKRPAMVVDVGSEFEALEDGDE